MASYEPEDDTPSVALESQAFFHGALTGVRIWSEAFDPTSQIRLHGMICSFPGDSFAAERLRCSYPAHRNYGPMVPPSRKAVPQRRSAHQTPKPICMNVKEDICARPQLSPQDAAQLARERFGVCGKACELPAERDQNFHLVCETGEQFVLKLSHPLADKEALECQNEAMRRVANRAGKGACSNLHPTRSGEWMTMVPWDDQRCAARLVSYLPGAPLATVDPHSRPF